MAQITKSKLTELYSSTKSMSTIAEELTVIAGQTVTTAQANTLFTQQGFDLKARVVKKKMKSIFEVVDDTHVNQNATSVSDGE